MKIYSVSTLCILCAFLFIPLCARNLQETVLQAHKAYDEGDHKKALDLYSSLEKKGHATWYNMGNCHFKLDNPLDALICWQKAERNASWSELPAIYNNIDKAHEALELEQPNQIYLTATRTKNKILSLYSLYGWQIIFLIVWTLLLFLSGQLIRRRRYITISFLSTSVLMCATALYLKHDITNGKYGIIREKNITVFAGPNKDFHELDNLDYSQKVTICQEDNEWLKIKSDTIVGWVAREDVAVI